MNAHNRRTFRRALAAATGFVPGSRVTLNNGASVYTVQQVSPSGRRDILVKRRDNRRVLFPVNELQAVPA